ncbi:aminoglycoside phosphotransferase family protein [Virgisporangium aurantiacum]|nr:aminoglycoside phosphotransferase family protein [Virgisporangium aurantiacum]
MSHDVVVVPGFAAVRFARTVQAEVELRRSATLLTVLADARLPLAVPRPVGAIEALDGRTALATTFVAGKPRPVPEPGLTDPAVLRDALDAIAAVPLDGISHAIGPPRAPAGGTEWADEARRHLLPRLNPPAARLVTRSIDEASALAAPATPVLVHGDLAGTNLLWQADRLVGVLDWDLAFAGDRAYDIACLADGFGWTVLETLFDSATIDRARIYRDVFLVESYLAHHRREATGAADQILEMLHRQTRHGTTAPPTPG